MSRIISPHGPTQILIKFNEQTGLTSCDIVDSLGRPKLLPLQQVNTIFAQLIVQFSEDLRAKGPLGLQECGVYRLAQCMIRFLKDVAERLPETPAKTPAKTPAGNGKVV
jgi:hypothetical protein